MILSCTVAGDSMVPTIHAGDSALVDHSQREPRGGLIFALSTEDGPLVKRIRQRVDGWWADSDNDAYEPRVLTEDDIVIGRVVWWAHTEGR